MIAAPHVFLFDGDAESLSSPALAHFTGEFLSALSEVDPAGVTTARLKVGLPMLSSFAGYVSAVTKSDRTSSHTQSFDMDTFKSLLWDFRNATSEVWHTLDPDNGMHLVGRDECECIALTALSLDLRDDLDAALRRVPGYVGAFALDAGNPVYRRAFCDGLMYLSAISGGSIIQELSYEGDQEWATTGGETFKPGGLVWRPYGWFGQNGPPDIPSSPVSARGRVTIRLLAAKRSDRPEDRVIEELSRSSFDPESSSEYTFAVTPLRSQVLEAVLPDTKFTGFLFNPQHEDGWGKAKFFVEQLGIEADDWRFLAAQFYAGLGLAKPRSLQLRSWEGGYGANFAAHIRVIGRNGSKAVIRTAWILKPGRVPQLVTAFPDKEDGEVVEPGEQPILDPGLAGADRWSALYELAVQCGLLAQEQVIPTPMFLNGLPTETEGACGFAYVVVGRRKGSFGGWLETNEKATRLPGAGVSVSSPKPTQSYERSLAFANAFARVVLLNGEDAKVEAHYS